MNFFESKNVKIFPCYSRGYFDSADQDGNTRILFDPEARLVTETNFANIYGNVLGRRSYIVEVNEGDQEGKGKVTKVVIQGYYFEISDFCFEAGETLWIRLAPITLSGATGSDSERITYSLSSLMPGEGNLDVLEFDSEGEPTNNYICTAIGYTANINDTPDVPDENSEGVVDYSLAFDTALRLDASGDNALAIFESRHKRAVESLGTFEFSDENGKTVQAYIQKLAEQQADLLDQHKSATEAHTKAQVGLDKVENKSIADITGAIEKDNTGFVTGGEVHSKFQSLEKLLGGVTNVMNFRGAVEKFEDVEAPVEGDVITFSVDVKDGDNVVVKIGSEWVYSKNTWVEIGTASASDAAIAALQGRMETAEGEIDQAQEDISALDTNKLNTSDFNTWKQSHEADHADKQEDITSAIKDAYDEAVAEAAELDDALEEKLIGGDADATYAKTIKGAKDYAKAYADSLATNYDVSGAADTAEQNAKNYADSLAGNYDASGAADKVKNELLGDVNTNTAGSATIVGAKKYADSLASNYDQAGAAERVRKDLLGDANANTTDSVTLAGVKRYADSLAKTLYGDTVPSSDALTLSNLKGLIDNLGGFTSGTDTPQIQNLAAETLARIAADTTLENAIGAPKNDEEEKDATGLYKYIDDTLQIECTARSAADSQLNCSLTEVIEELSEIGSNLDILTEYSEDIGRRTTELEEKVSSKTDYEELAATAAEANNFATNLVEQLRGTSSDNSEQITLHGVKKYFIEQLGAPSIGGETSTEASGVYATIEALDKTLTTRINGIVGISGDDGTQVLSLLEEQQLREEADEDIWEAIGAKAASGEGTDGEDGYVAPPPASGLYLYLDGAIAASNNQNSADNSKLRTDLFGSSEDNKDSLTIYGLRKRIDEKVASVDKEAGTAITVDNSDTNNPKIGLDINNSGNVVLSQSAAGLSAAIDLGAYKTDTENERKYKQLQEAITATTTDANVFVYGVAQDANGEISVETKAVDFSNYYTKEEIDLLPHENTAHTHANGAGTTVTTAGGIDGEVKVNLNVALELVDKTIRLYDKNDVNKTALATLDATDFIKDGMLNNVSYSAETNKLTFTWNTDAGEEANEVTLPDILDPYVFTEGANIDITVDGTNITIAHAAVATLSEYPGTGRKYLTGITTDSYGHITGFTTASETDQDLSDYKTKQTAYENTGGTKQTITKVTQSDNGVIEVTYGDIDFSHNHTTSEITDFSSAVADIEVNSAKKVACALTIKTTEKEEVSFDGSEAHTIDISHVTSEINKLTGDDTVEGSVANLVKTAIERAIIPKNIYAVAFDANGGEGTVQPQVIIGKSYKLPECSFSKPSTSYRFKGWGTSANAETPLTAGTGYTLTANTIFYALWETNEPTDQEPTE